MGPDARPPLIVLAGGPARHPSYLGDLAGLTRSRTLVVLHQRGVGDSAPSPTARAATWPELAEDVEALRNHLDLPTIELLGHSAGTRIALSYAARYPERLASLCLVTPPAHWLVSTPDTSAATDSAANDSAADDSAAIVAAHQNEPWFPDYLEHRPAALAAVSAAEANRLFAFIAPTAWAAWTPEAQRHEETGARHPDAQDRFFSGADPTGITAGLGQVSCPVLVVAGAQDGLTGHAPVLAVAELFDLGRAVTIQQAGHYPWVEQPAAFAAALSEFYGV